MEGEAKAQRGWAVAQRHTAGQDEASAKSHISTVPLKNEWLLNKAALGKASR